jgi:hypothetical protein
MIKEKLKISFLTSLLVLGNVVIASKTLAMNPGEDEKSHHVGYIVREKTCVKYRNKRVQTNYTSIIISFGEEKPEKKKEKGFVVYVGSDGRDPVIHDEERKIQQGQMKQNIFNEIKSCNNQKNDNIDEYELRPNISFCIRRDEDLTEMKSLLEEIKHENLLCNIKEISCYANNRNDLRSKGERILWGYEIPETFDEQVERQIYEQNLNRGPLDNRKEFEDFSESQGFGSAQFMRGAGYFSDSSDD